MKFPLNRETTCNLFWRLKRHPWRGSLLVASGQVFAPRERWEAASFQFASVSLCRVWGLVMATQPLSPGGLKLQLEEKPNETIIHCKGKITAENLEVFQREIIDLIPESRDPIAATAYSIVLDLRSVTHVDRSGLGALLGAWTAARDKGCDLEIANLNPRVEKLVEITKLDTVFKRGRIVAAGGSPSTPPGVEGALTVLDPEDACQQAIDAGMVVHRADPLNCETSIPALIGGVVMPNARFYVRNHFETPRLDPLSWRLEVKGLVERPLRLSLRDLHNVRSETLVATLECAGNGRSAFDPPA